MTERTQKAREKAWKRQRGFCLYCKNGVPLRQATLDHRIPLSEGGGWDEANCAMACGPCNTAKGNMPEEVFVKGETARREWRQKRAHEQRLMNADPARTIESWPPFGRANYRVRALVAVAEARMK